MFFICLIILTVLSVLFILQLFRGKQYDGMTEYLDDKSYPLKELYSVGFAWMQIPLFKIPSGTYEKMIGKAKLLYEKYAEYYANVCWAQILTMVHLELILGLIITVLLKSGLILVFTVGFAVVIAYYFYNMMETDIKKREMECTLELPEVVSTMALLINSGMVLKEAWEKVAYAKEGAIYELMRNACIDMENGISETDAIYKFGLLSNSNETKKFSSNLIQGLQKGSSEIAIMLANQSSEMLEVKRQHMLQKGEAAASKLIAPVGIIFIGILILVIAGAVGMFAS